jgi:hypothetical protein
MVPVLQFDWLAADQANVGLMDERGALQRVIRTFGAQVVMRQTVQLLVHDRNQIVQSLLIAALPTKQEFSHGMGWMLGHAPAPGFEKRSTMPTHAGPEETIIILHSSMYAPLISLAGDNAAEQSPSTHILVHTLPVGRPVRSFLTLRQFAGAFRFS